MAYSGGDDGGSGLGDDNLVDVVDVVSLSLCGCKPKARMGMTFDFSRRDETGVTWAAGTNMVTWIGTVSEEVLQWRVL